ncbi:MAG: hypothetical protein ACTSW7_01390 [Candidatus Thorarchaeota archaeon]|nr:hypothetical protein [Thermoplasmatales archaeon]
MPVNMRKLKKRIKEHRKERESFKPLIVVDDGEDVVFNMGGERMGIWKGSRTSVMARDHEGRHLLRWLLDKDFNEEALEIIQYQLDEVYL